MYSWRADTPAKKEKETPEGVGWGVHGVATSNSGGRSRVFTPFSPPLALWRVYVCVEQLLEWMHGVQSAAEVCCNKSNAGVKYQLKLWRVGGNRGGWDAGKERSGVVDLDRGKIIRWEFMAIVVEEMIG